MKAQLATIRREIANLLRAIERGSAPGALVERIAGKEDEGRRLAAAIDAVGRPAPKHADLARINRLLTDHMNRFSDVMRSDVVRARRALQQLLTKHVLFTPTTLPDGRRTYRLEATLSLGGLLRGDDCSKGASPTGFEPVLPT